jgi:malate dehydrogenase
VPVILGGGGIEKIVDISLSADEKAALEKSASSVRKVVEVVKNAAQ